MQLTIEHDAVPIDEALLERLAETIFAREGRSLRVSIVVVDDETIAAIHDESMGDPSVTDVIAFDLSGEGSPEDCEDDVDGEIIVNADLAQREAAERGHAPEAELLFYVAHGLLHLLGHDDATPGERTAMHAKQREYLSAVGVTVKD